MQLWNLETSPSKFNDNQPGKQLKEIGTLGPSSELCNPTSGNELITGLSPSTNNLLFNGQHGGSYKWSCWKRILLFESTSAWNLLNFIFNEKRDVLNKKQEGWKSNEEIIKWITSIQ